MHSEDPTHVSSSLHSHVCNVVFWSGDLSLGVVVFGVSGVNE